MYLDPAFGGMLLQIIVVIAALGGTLIFSLRKKIRALFTKNKNTSQKAAQDTAGSTQHSSPADTTRASGTDGLIDTLSDKNE